MTNQQTYDIQTPPLTDMKCFASNTHSLPLSLSSLPVCREDVRQCAGGDGPSKSVLHLGGFELPHEADLGPRHTHPPHHQVPSHRTQRLPERLAHRVRCPAAHEREGSSQVSSGRIKASVNKGIKSKTQSLKGKTVKKMFKGHV